MDQTHPNTTSLFPSRSIDSLIVSGNLIFNVSGKSKTVTDEIIANPAINIVGIFENNSLCNI